MTSPSPSSAPGTSQQAGTSSKAVQKSAKSKRRVSSRQSSTTLARVQGVGDWGTPITPPPSKDEIRTFNIQHQLTPDHQARWRLPSEENGLTRMRHSLLKSYLFQNTDLFTDSLPAHGLHDRISSILSHPPESSTDSTTSLCTPRIASLLCQFARYLDSWDQHVHSIPILNEYQEFGLVPVPPGMVLAPNSAQRKQLVQVISSMLILDRFIATLRFYHDSDASFDALKHKCNSYNTDLDQLFDSSHAIYSSGIRSKTPIPRACQDLVGWRAFGPPVDEFARKLVPGEITNESFDSLVSRLKTIAVRADRKVSYHAIESNVCRLVVTMLTLFGMLSGSLEEDLEGAEFSNFEVITTPDTQSRQYVVQKNGRQLLSDEPSDAPYPMDASCQTLFNVAGLSPLMAAQNKQMIRGGNDTPQSGILHYLNNGHPIALAHGQLDPVLIAFEFACLKGVLDMIDNNGNINNFFQTVAEAWRLAKNLDSPPSFSAPLRSLVPTSATIEEVEEVEEVEEAIEEPVSTANAPAEGAEESPTNHLYAAKVAALEARVAELQKQTSREETLRIQQLDAAQRLYEAGLAALEAKNQAEAKDLQEARDASVREAETAQELRRQSEARLIDIQNEVARQRSEDSDTFLAAQRDARRAVMVETQQHVSASQSGRHSQSGRAHSSGISTNTGTGPNDDPEWQKFLTTTAQTIRNSLKLESDSQIGALPPTDSQYFPLSPNLNRSDDEFSPFGIPSIPPQDVTSPTENLSVDNSVTQPGVMDEQARRGSGLKHVPMEDVANGFAFSLGSDLDYMSPSFGSQPFPWVPDYQSSSYSTQSLDPSQLSIPEPDDPFQDNDHLSQLRSDSIFDAIAEGHALHHHFLGADDLNFGVFGGAGAGTGGSQPSASVFDGAGDIDDTIMGQDLEIPGEQPQNTNPIDSDSSSDEDGDEEELDSQDEELAEVLAIFSPLAGTHPKAQTPIWTPTPSPQPDTPPDLFSGVSQPPHSSQQSLPPSRSILGVPGFSMSGDMGQADSSTRHPSRVPATITTLLALSYKSDSDSSDSSDSSNTSSSKRTRQNSLDADDVNGSQSDQSDSYSAANSDSGLTDLLADPFLVEQITRYPLTTPHLRPSTSNISSGQHEETHFDVDAEGDPMQTDSPTHFTFSFQDKLDEIAENGSYEAFYKAWKETLVKSNTVPRLLGTQGKDSDTDSNDSSTHEQAEDIPPQEVGDNAPQNNVPDDPNDATRNDAQDDDPDVHHPQGGVALAKDPIVEGDIPMAEAKPEPRRSERNKNTTAPTDSVVTKSAAEKSSASRKRKTATVDKAGGVGSVGERRQRKVPPESHTALYARRLADPKYRDLPYATYWGKEGPGVPDNVETYKSVPASAHSTFVIDEREMKQEEPNNIQLVDKNVAHLIIHDWRARHDQDEVDLTDPFNHPNLKRITRTVDYRANLDSSSWPLLRETCRRAIAFDTIARKTDPLYDTAQLDKDGNVDLSPIGNVIHLHEKSPLIDARYLSALFRERNLVFHRDPSNVPRSHFTPPEMEEYFARDPFTPCEVQNRDVFPEEDDRSATQDSTPSATPVPDPPLSSKVKKGKKRAAKKGLDPELSSEDDDSDDDGGEETLRSHLFEMYSVKNRGVRAEEAWVDSKGHVKLKTFPALNALDIPMLERDWTSKAYRLLAHDGLAWNTTAPYQSSTSSKIPAGVKSFGIASLNGATSDIHMDDDGFAVFIEVIEGHKLFLVGTPIHPTLFSTNKRRRHTSKSIIYDMFWESILAGPGDSVIFKPGTHHMVITVNEIVDGMVRSSTSLARGAHFYNMNTMDMTLHARWRVSRWSPYITNADKPEAVAMINRMVFMLLVKIPDILQQQDADAVADLVDSRVFNHRFSHQSVAALMWMALCPETIEARDRNGYFLMLEDKDLLAEIWNARCVAIQVINILRERGIAGAPLLNVLWNVGHEMDDLAFHQDDMISTGRRLVSQAHRLPSPHTDTSIRTSVFDSRFHTQRREYYNTPAHTTLSTKKGFPTPGAETLPPWCNIAEGTSSVDVKQGTAAYTGAIQANYAKVRPTLAIRRGHLQHRQEAPRAAWYERAIDLVEDYIRGQGDDWTADDGGGKPAAAETPWFGVLSEEDVQDKT